MTPNLWILSPFNFLLLCLVAFLETSLFFLLLLVCLFWAWVRPSAGHHVTNRAVLQRVFQSWLVWIRGIDWRAGLSIHPQDMETLPAELAQPGARKTTDLGEAWAKFSFLDPLRLCFQGIFNVVAYFSSYHRCRNCTNKHIIADLDVECTI